MAFKINNKIFFLTVEVCGQKSRFSHICENTKENLFNLGEIGMK